MTRNFQLLGIAFGVLAMCVAATYAAPPFRVGSICDQVIGRLENPVPNLRLDIAKIPESANIDPAPGPLSVEKHAAVIVTINADYNRERIRDVVLILQKASWRRLPDPKVYTKTRIRFIGPWEVLLEMGVANDGSALKVDGIWYEVGPTVVGQLVSLFQKVVAGELEMNPAGQPKHGEDRRAKEE